MKLPWGKKKSEPQSTSGASWQQDAPLSLLDEADAAYLRELFLANWPAERGPLTMRQGSAVDQGGQLYNLHDLSARVRTQPREDWPATVAQHVRVMLAAGETQAGADFLPQARSRVLPDDFLPAEDIDKGFRYRRPVADGLVEIIMLDYPEHTASLSDTDAEKVPVELLWQAARDGLRAEPWGQLYEADTPGGPIIVFAGDSVFTASRVLQFDEVLAHFGFAAPHGVVLGLPFRNQIPFVPIGTGRPTGSVADLLRFTVQGYSDGAGSISPHLFYWKDGVLERVTTKTGDTIAITPSERYARTIAELQRGAQA